MDPVHRSLRARDRRRRRGRGRDRDRFQPRTRIAPSSSGCAATRATGGSWCRARRGVPRLPRGTVHHRGVPQPQRGDGAPRMEGAPNPEGPRRELAALSRGRVERVSGLRSRGCRRPSPRRSRPRFRSRRRRGTLPAVRGDHTATIAGMQLTAPATMKAIAAPALIPCSTRPRDEGGSGVAVEVGGSADERSDHDGGEPFATDHARDRLRRHVGNQQRLQQVGERQPLDEEEGVRERLGSESRDATAFLPEAPRDAGVSPPEPRSRRNLPPRPPRSGVAKAPP